MSPASMRLSERCAELLADDVSAGLDEGDRPELDTLLGGETGSRGRDEYLRTASLVQLALLCNDTGSARRIPDQLRRKLADQADAYLDRRAAPAAIIEIAGARSRRTTAMPPKRWISGASAGWALAAALAIAFVVNRQEAVVIPAAAPPADERQQLLAGARDVVTIPWQRPNAPGYEGVSGDVVWSDTRQTGYLRLTGMPRNDPASAQYQLWIVDPERDAHPVDGGVFNVGANGEVIIPIQARLRVTAPKAFAITLEKPGGVVVSAGPLLVVASG